MEVNCILTPRSVFVAGETLKCGITFINKACPEGGSESIAWASAQIHCTATLSPEARNALQSTSTTPEASAASAASASSPPPQLNTHLQPMKGEIPGTLEIFTTKPKILFCDISLSNCQNGNGNKSYSVEYQEKVPENLPPSYTGSHIKYSYRIIIGTQKVNSSIKLLKIPFRVLPCSKKVDPRRSSDNLMTSVNPFLLTEKSKNESSIANDDFHFAKKSVRYFEIASSKGKLGKLCLYKLMYKLGEDLNGNFEFYNDELRCVEYSVSVKGEETIKGKKIGKSYGNIAKFHEVTVGLQYSNIELQIPLHMTPTFTSEHASLNYNLHFVFVITPKFPFQGEDDEHNEWNGPKNLPIETMIWDLPIKIFPTTPNLVSHVLQPTTKHIARINL